MTHGEITRLGEHFTPADLTALGGYLERTGRPLRAGSADLLIARVQSGGMADAISELATADEGMEHAVTSAEDLAEPGELGIRPTPGKSQPRKAAAGIFTHENAEHLRKVLPPPLIPQQFATDVIEGDIIPLSELPDGLLAEEDLGVTSRVDRISVDGAVTTIFDGSSGIIYEIKPDNAKAIVEGLAQAMGYRNLANSSRKFGRGDWRTVIVVYNQKAALRYIP